MTVKISNLPAATSLGDGDLIPIVQGGTTKKLDFVGDAVTQSATDTTAGRLLKVEDFGIGADRVLVDDSAQFKSRWDVRTLETLSPFGSGITQRASVLEIPGLFVARSCQIAIKQTTGTGQGPEQIAFRTQQGTDNGWEELYHTGNTTVDANGFVKEASPIVRLFSDHLEEHLQPQGAEFERVDVGHYRITGTLGFAQEGWWIETPKDANGSIKFMTEYEQEDDGTIVIKTYEPIGTGWRPEKGHPVDITEGRWIDIRLQAPEPEEE